MTQRLQWHTGGEQAWLALLVQTFETASREPITTCSPASLAALKAQLARPAAASGKICLH